MLSKINDALATLDLPVFYGIAGNMRGEDLWDYVVFYRTATNPSASKRGMTDVFTVALVQENFVDDEKLSNLIKAVKTIPGVSVAQSGITYEYMVKPGTTTVLEAAEVPFVKPSKVCNHG